MHQEQTPWPELESRTDAGLLNRVPSNAPSRLDNGQIASWLDMDRLSADGRGNDIAIHTPHPVFLQLSHEVCPIPSSSRHRRRRRDEKKRGPKPKKA